jgi:hypothetical protein
MNDPETLGLNVTNSILGFLVAASLLVVFSAVLREIARQVKKRESRRRHRALVRKAAAL